MNQTETVNVLAALNRAGLVRVVEGQAAVWADALQSVRYPDAVEAARRMIATRTSENRWVTPGDLRAEIRSLRAARLTAVPPPLPAVDPDDVAAYQAERRRLIEAIADGRINPNQIGA